MGVVIAMPRKRLKNDYERFWYSALTYSNLDLATDLTDYAYSMEKLEEYVEGAPCFAVYHGKTPSCMKLESVLEEYKRERVEEFKESFTSEFKEFLYAIKRYKPSYVSIMEWLIEHPEYIRRYHEAKPGELNEFYREVAKRTGYAFTTTRDAFSYMRQSGLLA